MAEAIVIFDIENVGDIYKKMAPLKSFPPVELTKHFINNYLSQEYPDFNDPIKLSLIYRAYTSHQLGVRYLIDKDESMIKEVYDACANQSR